MGKVLTAVYECMACHADVEGQWPVDADDLEDLDGAPEAMQNCPCGSSQLETYPGWTYTSEAG